MTQSHRLIETIKSALRSRGMTYRSLAKTMTMSEANIKRMFSKRALSLKQLEEICEIIDMDFYELARLAQGQIVDVLETLTLEQERALAADPQLFVFFYLLNTGNSLKEIEKHYSFSHSTLQLLIRLDKLGLIELLPNNRVKMKIRRNVRWNNNGPLSEKYEKTIKTEFLDSAFSGKMEKLRFLFGEMSEPSLRQFQNKLDKLIGEFIEATQWENQQLHKTPPSHKAPSVWFLVALRPWKLSVMSRYRKND